MSPSKPTFRDEGQGCLFVSLGSKKRFNIGLLIFYHFAYYMAPQIIENGCNEIGRRMKMLVVHGRPDQSSRLGSHCDVKISLFAVVDVACLLSKDLVLHHTWYSKHIKTDLT